MVIHYEEALYQVYAPLPLQLRMHTIHFTASFKGSMSKPVPECQTMLDFAVERDDGSSDNSWISYGMQSCNQITVTNILTLNTRYFAGRMPFPAPD